MTDEIGVAGVAGDSGTTDDPLRTLLVLQDHDVALDRLRHRRDHLPERAAVAELDRDLARVDSELAGLEPERLQLRARQAELEEAIDAASRRIDEIEQRLYHGAAAAFRDQQAMAVEVSALKERRTQLEDDELEVMEALEPLDAAAGELETRRDDALAARAEAVGALAVAEASIDGEIAAERSERAGVAAGLPDDLAADYERLRAKLGGVGAARLVAGSCTGCHLTLPATEIDRVRHAPAGARFHCEQCGRLLIP